MLYFCFYHHVGLLCPMSFTEESCHLGIYLITLHSRWVQEYRIAVKVKNISMHIVSTNDRELYTQGKPPFKIQEFFIQADIGSYYKSVVVISVCLILKLVILSLCICGIS